MSGTKPQKRFGKPRVTAKEILLGDLKEEKEEGLFAEVDEDIPPASLFSNLRSSNFFSFFRKVPNYDYLSNHCVRLGIMN